MDDACLDDRTAKALDHVERNGTLAWMDAPTPDVTRAYGELEAKGYVERNPWSGRLVLTEAAQAARRRTRDIDDLARFAREMAGRPRA